MRDFSSSLTSLFGPSAQAVLTFIGDFTVMDDDQKKQFGDAFAPSVQDIDFSSINAESMLGDIFSKRANGDIYASALKDGGGRDTYLKAIDVINEKGLSEQYQRALGLGTQAINQLMFKNRMASLAQGNFMNNLMGGKSIDPMVVAVVVTVTGLFVSSFAGEVDGLSKEDVQKMYSTYATFGANAGSKTE